MSWKIYCVECGNELTDKEALNVTPAGGSFCENCREAVTEGLV